ncbi:tripartite tricarboxylate transporter substrate-binding protein [Parapusillimonas granuli]|uniref:Tripartite tricarboxylate transporter substrate binding protein n=1 Tax=Parapusillimonas granuli TaxID=380911 RepID=A0A853GAG8_9BURK|nr:tripartite-type tricarboxylate transporter receptor subunit TctC [Parapusillimonas granuli]MEB2399169.1 tripartite tricarboxylate transporter substrate-binding protein [Alcaligenaceae bacterium]NYT51890.1 hypothetical protein [Parapusillimonas granuli]
MPFGLVQIMQSGSGIGQQTDAGLGNVDFACRADEQLGAHLRFKFIIPNLAYDPLTSFTPISMLYRNTLVLAVNNDFRIDSLPALVDDANKNPGKLTFGTPGVGTPHQLVGELIKEKAGIDMMHVPYKGSGQIMTDLVGGHINLAVSAQAAALEMYRAGKVKILATADKERSRQLPEVPAVSETFPDFDVAGWGGKAMGERTL